jgi:Ankyrin repeats (3 copies)
LQHWAARSGHLETVRLLLEKGAVVDLKNATGNTPLHLASHNGRVEVTYALLDAGADILAENSGGRTPLQVADNQHTEAAMRMHKVLNSPKETLEAIVKKSSSQEKANMVLETVAQIAVLHEMFDKRMEDINDLKVAKLSCEKSLVDNQKSMVYNLQEKATRAEEYIATIDKCKVQIKQHQEYLAVLAKRTKECADYDAKCAAQERERTQQDAKLIAEMTALQKKLANYEMRDDTVKKTLATINLVLNGGVE